jgi:hypothetical protein
MSKRLQVLIEDSEYREIQSIARSRRMTVAEWVRTVLRLARRRETPGEPGRKLEAVRAAIRHSFPTGDMDQILSETERGYLEDRGTG